MSRAAKFAIVVLLLSLVTGVLWQRTRQKSGAAVPAVLEARSTGTPQVKARDVFSKPVAPMAVVAEMPVECRDSWAYLMETSLERVHSDYAQGRLLITEECLQRRPDISTATIKELRKCLVRVPTDAQKKSCLESLVHYRARIITEAHKNIADKDLSSTVLMNKLLGLFSAGAMSPAQVDKIAQTAAALVEKEPQLYAAHKALAAARMLGYAMHYEQEGERAARLKSYQTALQEAQRHDREADPELFEATLLGEIIEGDYTKLEPKVEVYGREHPNSGLPYYYRAAAAWRERRRADVVAHLQEAIRLEPTHQRYRDTLDRVNKAKLGAEGLFGFNLNFGFQDI